MTGRVVQINDKKINIDDILEISEFVNEKKSNILPYGYSIVLKDFSIINVVCIPNTDKEENKQEEIFSSYKIIKNYLIKKINLRDNFEK
jgi:hypothetical protein